MGTPVFTYNWRVIRGYLECMVFARWNRASVPLILTFAEANILVDLASSVRPGVSDPLHRPPSYSSTQGDMTQWVDQEPTPPAILGQEQSPNEILRLLCRQGGHVQTITGPLTAINLASVARIIGFSILSFPPLENPGKLEAGP